MYYPNRPEDPPKTLEEVEAERLTNARAGKMTLFVVRGSTGEYSDHHTWPVAVFVTLAEAEAHEVACQDWARTTGCGRTRPRGEFVDYDFRHKIIEAIQNGWLPEAPDQNFICDYTGTDYYVEELPLRITSKAVADGFADALMEMRALMS